MLISPDDGIRLPRNGRMPMIHQNEAGECGLACLAMIASSYGHSINLIEMRQRFSISSTGVTLKTLMDIADSMLLISRPVRLEVDDLGKLKLPAILHWDMDHFVVLSRVKPDRVLIHDPARGVRWVTRGEVNHSFSGIAVEFTPSHDLRYKKRQEATSVAGLFKSTRGLTPSLVQMFALASVMQIFALSSPILNQLVIDEAITKGDLGLLNVLALAMLLLALTTAGIRALQGFVGLYMTTQMSFQMQSNLLRHILRLPVSWFEKRHVGDILSRFASMGPVQNVLLNSVPATVLNTIIATSSAVMMVIYAPLLSAIEFISVILLLVIRTLTFPYIRDKTQEGLHLEARVQTRFLETIRGARTFKLFGTERERVAVWQNEQAALINNKVSLSRFALLGGTGTTVLAGIQQLLVWFLGARLVISGQMSLGMLFAFQAYTAQFGTAIFAVIDQFFSFKAMRVHLERLSDVTHAAAELGLDAPADPNPRPVGSLAMKGIGFRYGENDPWVLRNVSFEIAPGELICIGGPSGHGKSTLLKLLLGFESPNEGRVLVDGEDLQSYGIRSYRSQIGAVLQDDVLFAGTIADNISFFDINANEDRILQAARAACIHDEITMLPMKYRTLTGDLGSTLSAGQRQRVLLARALYRQPTILILDEGTANLDPTTEDSVMLVVESLSITRIVVAHRERAARHASRYFMVEKGQLSEVQPRE